MLIIPTHIYWLLEVGIKIHFAVNVKTKEVVSMSVTTDEVHDSKEAKKLIDDASKKYDVNKAYMDGAYDSRDIFRYLESKSIIPVIKVRRNSILDGSVRDRYVMMQLLHYNKWKKKFGYDYRWIVESVFSMFKRIFGEYVSAKKFENIVNEIILKMRIYNLMTRMMNIA